MLRKISTYKKHEYLYLGGKAFSILNLINSGFNVPSAYILDTNVFDDLVGREVKSHLANMGIISANNRQGICEFSKKIQNIIDGIDIVLDINNLDNKYAVRSSANLEDSTKHSFAGRFDSFLNVEKCNLISGIKNVWKSTYSTQAISYCLSKNIPISNLKMAVIIQEMVRADVSGVAFSNHPVTKENLIFIESVLGLADVLVSGSATPDNYTVEPSTFSILDKSISTQKQIHQKDGTEKCPCKLVNSQKISNEQIIQVSKNLMSIKNESGNEIDIEWAYEGSKLYILQSRPITT